MAIERKRRPIGQSAQVVQSMIKKDYKGGSFAKPTSKKKSTPIIKDEDTSTGITTMDDTDVKTPTYDATADIKALGEERKKKQIAGLSQRLSGTLGDIGERRAELTPEYREQKRQASVRSRVGGKNLREALAQRGLARSGASAQQMMMEQMGIQQQLGGLGRQEQAERDKLARSEQQARQQYASDVGMAEAGIGADVMGQLIGARQQEAMLGRQDLLRGQEIARADAIRQEDLVRQDALRQQQARSQYLGQMGIADPYGGQMLSPEQMRQVSPYQQDYAAALQDPTLDPAQRALIEQARFQKVTADPRSEFFQQYGREYMTPESRQFQESQYSQSIAGNALPDYQQEINNVTDDGDPLNDWKIPLLEAERQRKIAALDVKAQEKIADDYARALDTWDRAGKEGANQFVADALGVPLGAKTSDQSYRDSQINLEQQRVNISQQNANTAATNATNKTDKDDDIVKNKDFYLERALDMLEPKFDNALGQWTSPWTIEQAEDYIVSSSLTEEEQLDILNKINTPRPKQEVIEEPKGKWYNPFD